LGRRGLAIGAGKLGHLRQQQEHICLPQAHAIIPMPMSCPIKMSSLKPCGRTPYSWLSDQETTSSCIMHTHKRKTNEDAGFWEEIQRLLRSPDEVIDFTRFVFPKCDFSETTFPQKVSFYSATFTGDVSFIAAGFAKMAVFVGTTFLGEANFSRAEFQDEAMFTGSTFARDTYFGLTIFKKPVRFDSVRFLAGAHFRESVFLQDEQRRACADFSFAQFEKPDSVIFFRVDLGRTLFRQCAVSRITFSQVEWPRRSNGKKMVFEESLVSSSAEVNDSRNERDWLLVGELYQQLKRNYDNRKDYWTAGDFHYGEMEVTRLSTPHRNPILRWLHRNVGLVAWYKYASEYGESYVRPAVRLLIMMIVLAFVYPVPGLRDANGQVFAYSDLFQSSTAHSVVGMLIGLFAKGLLTAFEVASLRRELLYEPIGAGGHLLAIVEVLLTSTLLSLFLLALRRQFRR
jgi:hypothetical protein